MSYFRPNVEALQGYVPGEQPQSGEFIKLNTNENPYPPSGAVQSAIVIAARDALVRYPEATATEFRERAAGLLGVEPDWILCGNGSDEILTILTRAYVGEGQMVRLPYPSYVLYKTLAGIQGARTEEVPFESDWTLPDRFGQQAADLRLAFLPNPNSPSGTMISSDRVLELAERLPCPLVVDEAYVDFAEAHCLDLVRQNEKVLVTRSLSKSYALAGLRFGFLVAQPQIIQQLVKLKDSYNCDALSIAAASAAIDDQTWLMANRAKILATRRRLSAAMCDLGFEVPQSQANFVWCMHRKRPVEPLYRALREERILVRYMDYPGWGGGLRVSVGTDEQINAFLSALETMI